MKKWIVAKIFPLIRNIRWQIYGKRKYLNQIAEKYNLKKNIRNIFIIGIPNHANLGDYAIGYAEQKLMELMYPDANVTAVNMSHFGQDIEGIRDLSYPQDILILTGGGNLGNVYMDDENIRRRTIRMFPDNLIILFPQTMYFTEDEEGKAQAEITKQIYNNHKHIILTAREKYTLKAMEDLFEKRCYLLPDVVMTLALGDSDNRRRKGAYLCLRSDQEGIFKENDKKYLNSLLQQKYDFIDSFDTVRNDILDPSCFPQAFKELLEIFRKAEIVITDRLHGMILAAVTQTPCIVLNNFNYKVRGCYEWLEDVPYIKFVTDLTEIESAIDIVGDVEDCAYNADDYRKKYEKFLEEVING